MGKTFSEHSVLFKDANDKVLKREEFASFVEAKPVFEARKDQLSSGQYLTLQHMTRLIDCFDPWKISNND